VFGGYTEPEGSRKHFGALLVGFYEGKNVSSEIEIPWIFQLARNASSRSVSSESCSAIERTGSRNGNESISRFPGSKRGVRLVSQESLDRHFRSLLPQRQNAEVLQ
jgi:hypothetical protein